MKIFQRLKVAFLYYFPPTLFLPWFTYRADKVKKNKNIREIIDFVYTGFFGIIMPCQVKSEITALASIVQKLKPKTIVEIGTCKGGTLFLWSCLVSSEGVITSIDLPNGNYGGGYHDWNIPFYKSFARGKQKINLIRDNSHEKSTLARLKKILNGNLVDFLFIDGDHSERGVSIDFRMYSPLVRKGGVIALHDVAHCEGSNNCGVDLFWKKIKGRFRTEEIIEDINQDWAGIGVVVI